ncbi:MAG: exodeoxyribonuclease VII small subunit [Pseudomonadales bacterium]|nr:exodeoxyribonuclease VII small subunit [Pseudomonadales bacterium]
MSKKEAKPDFETSLETLESLVERMESGELSLEDSLAAFEQGIQLTKSCQQALKDAEQRVKVLIEENGSEELRAFSATDDESAS